MCLAWEGGPQRRTDGGRAGGGRDAGERLGRVDQVGEDGQTRSVV